MQTFTPKELEDAGVCIASLIRKCRKAGEKLAAGSAQRTLLTNRIKALEVAQILIKQQRE